MLFLSSNVTRKKLVVFLSLLSLFIVVAGCNRPSGSPAPAPAPQEEQPSQETQVNTINSSVFGMEAIRLRKGDRITQIQASGTNWVRLNGVIWSDIEPQEGTREWNALSSIEEDILAASEAGIKPIVIIRSTPPWAQAVEGSYCGPISEGKLASFGQFLVDLVARLSAPPFNVKHWELWNEPDIPTALVDPNSAFGCWGSENDEYFGGGYYAKMLQGVYPLIKTADPGAQVLVGGLLLDCDPRNPTVDKKCTAGKFLEGILVDGGGPFFDGISFHAYDFYYYSEGTYGNQTWDAAWETTGPVFSKKTQFINELLAEYNISQKYLINTEGALLCIKQDEDDLCNTVEFEKTKAAYLAQSYATAIAINLKANIWYSFTGWRASGLVDKNLTPHPAYRAYQFAAQELSDVEYVQELTLYPGVFGHGFQRDNTVIWVLWSSAGLQQTIDLPIPPDGIFNLYGDPLSLTSQLEVNYEPVYIVWNDLQ